MCYPTLILFQSLFLSLFLFLSVNLYAHHLAKSVLIRIDKHGKISELSDQDNRMSRTTATVGFFGPALGRLLPSRQTSNSFRSHRKNGGSTLARKTGALRFECNAHVCMRMNVIFKVICCFILMLLMFTFQVHSKS